jgi:hypothetical protein
MAGRSKCCSQLLILNTHMNVKVSIIDLLISFLVNFV